VLPLPAGYQHYPAGIGVFFDIGKRLLYYAVQVKLIFDTYAAKVQVFFYDGEALDPRSLAKGGAETGKGIFEGKPGEIRRHKLGADFANPGSHDLLLTDNRLFFRRFAPGPGKTPYFGKHRVVEFAGNAPPFRFLSRDCHPGKGKVLSFPFLGLAHSQIEIADEGYQEKHDDHGTPQEAEMDFKFRGR
jgi:hypothetical protein